MTDIDVDEVAKAMDSLSEVLEHEELVVQRTLPLLTPADALDTALRRALARLRFELNRASFEYLRWKLALARAENLRLRATRELRLELPTPTGVAVQPTRPGPRGRQSSRSYTSESGVIWTVAAIHTLTPTDPAHASCLVFTSEESVTYRWDYPSNWFELSDRQLDELRRTR
jgi:hypothetical protein